MDEVLLIAGTANPVLADYAGHCLRAGRKISVTAAPEVCAKIPGPTEDFGALSRRQVRGMVVFLDRNLGFRERTFLDEVAATALEHRAECVCLVSTFRVHFGDRAAARVEAFALRLFRNGPGRVVILRTAPVVSRQSPLAAFLRDSWYWFPLLPDSWQGCCVEGKELFAAIDRELDRAGPRKTRTFTLLGANQPWQSRLRNYRRGRLARAYPAVARFLLPLVLFRFLAGLLLGLLARHWRHFQAWHIGVLRPRSFRELLTLYNPYNHRHLKIVGYNNGAVHFGQRYPGKTVVSTVGCNRRLRLRGDVADFDAGVTIRQAMDFLGPRGKELPVLPNYSYVSLGTAFFIPIHGSASKFSTIGETIEKVLLYDPAGDRFLSATRHDPAFGHYLYNLGAEALLLRLSVQTKEKSRYHVKQLEVQDPPSREILDYFHDNRPANVEVRKAGSAAKAVKVAQYFTEPGAGDGAALDLPRDAIGRLWDRLEENPVAAFLFHGLTRRFLYHVELFLSEPEFATFWETHRALPILKIQLRYIRRDGFPHSPFRLHDCITADLVTLKKHKGVFDAYLKNTLPAAQMNPGKHTL
jgi:hypothetical protein